MDLVISIINTCIQMAALPPVQESAKIVWLLFGIDWTYYLLCGFGAFVLFFRSHTKFEVVGYINPNWKNHPFARLGEALIFSFFGAIIGTIITQPTNPQQAIMAGLGWTGLVTRAPGSFGGKTK